MHQQATRQPHEPAEVEQRREQVAAEGEHPDRVEDFRVRRVEPGQELRRDEVQVQRVAALEEAGRERAVVPGAVEPGHPGAEPQPHAGGEVDDRDRRDRQGDQGRDVDAPAGGSCSGSRGACGGAASALDPLAPPAGAAPQSNPDSDRRSRYGTGSNSAEGPEQLGDPDQEREREHRGRELGRRARRSRAAAAPRSAVPRRARRSRRAAASSATPSR